MARRNLRTILVAVTLVATARRGVIRADASEVVSQLLSTHATRESSDDLEITGLPGKPQMYLNYADLVRMPQVTKTINGGPDFNNATMRISGVYLEALQQALGVPATFDLIDALCSDRYRSHFPAEYIRQHQPILVLKVDGLKPAEWAVNAHQDDPGPYFVAYADFVPAFHILAHADQPALPTNVVRINFSTEAKTFGPIAPPAPFAADTQVQQGFAIAKQNCLRCHFRGYVGGTKSGRDWFVLSKWARDEPAFFSKYILDPKSVEPHAHMPANPQYDAATTAALTAYFRTFTESATVGKGGFKR